MSQGILQVERDTFVNLRSLDVRCDLAAACDTFGEARDPVRSADTEPFFERAQQESDSELSDVEASMNPVTFLFCSWSFSLFLF